MPLFLKCKSACSFSLSPSLLLAIALFFPLRLLGADQPVPLTERSASQPAQTVPQAEQPASQPVQTVPQAEQPASQPVQTVPLAEQPVSPPKKPAPKAQPAAPKPEPPVPPAEEPDGFEPLDAPRNYMSEKIISFASYMDHFFGGNRHYQESNQSVLRLDMTRVVGYGDNHKFDFSG